MDASTGYHDPQYVYSLEEFGQPRKLDRCGGWVLERSIPRTPYKDAVGCYPLFACRDWTKLHEDLENIGSGLVSLSLVVDPFSGASPEDLSRTFDLVRPFKIHYVVDLSRHLESFVCRTHRKKARKALAAMDVEICSEPARYLNEWIRLYDTLIRRHGIRGINMFSHRSFERQLRLTGMTMFVGWRKREIVGALLVLVSGNIAYFHLSAFSREGYRIRASYGLFWKALVYGSEIGIRYFHLGGTAGLRQGPDDGLARFKKGWSNEQRIAYFCGRIFDRQKYEAVCRLNTIAAGGVDYFPAYRAGEPLATSSRAGLRSL